MRGESSPAVHNRRARLSEIGRAFLFFSTREFLVVRLRRVTAGRKNSAWVDDSASTKFVVDSEMSGSPANRITTSSTHSPQTS